MACSDLNQDCTGARSSTEQHLAEQGVLGLLLEAHPGLRSVDEILREMTDDSKEFAERDLIENAIRDLVRAGLAHRHGRFVFATHARRCARTNSACDGRVNGAAAAPRWGAGHAVGCGAGTPTS
jgi:hypothetical protein